MPKLTRSVFIAGVADLWVLAQRNFEKDGYVHGCIAAVDAMGRQNFFMHGPADDERILANGWVPVPGPWLDHLPLIQHHLREWKSVAAIMIGEAWSAKDEVALEVIEMDIAPHEHPMKDEVVFVAGFWPREFVATGHQAVIERDERGENGHLTGPEELTGDDRMLLASWLPGLLPQPH